jgi:hypothetical protein
MITSKNILVHVSTYNREKLTKLCLKQLHKHKQESWIWVHDDGSNYDISCLSNYCDVLVSSENKGPTQAVLGSFKQVYDYIKNENMDHIKYIYHSDNDMYHDECYMDVLVSLYNKYNLPTTLFFHKYDVVLDRYDDAILNKNLPGASILFPVKWIEKINQNHAGGWDGYLSEVFGNKFICSSPSYVEHYDYDGYHSWVSDTDGRNFAINPSKYLESKKSYILKEVLLIND